MGALPKTRVSRGRRDRRRTHHKITPRSLVECDHCGEKKLPHRVCMECGFYRGREIFEIEE